MRTNEQVWQLFVTSMLGALGPRVVAQLSCAGSNGGEEAHARARRGGATLGKVGSISKHAVAIAPPFETHLGKYWAGRQYAHEGLVTADRRWLRWQPSSCHLDQVILLNTQSYRSTCKCTQARQGGESLLLGSILRSGLGISTVQLSVHMHMHRVGGWMTWMHKWLWHGDFGNGSLLAASILPASSECCCKF